jgi:antitoxin component YwqK of YwqJK toxin-antitoxin module
MTAPINQFNAQGRPHGVWENYRGNGILMWRGYYLHGKLHGLCEWYRVDGTLYFKRYYLTIK